MNESETNERDLDADDLEVIIVGAGITGIHQLYLLREAGFSVRLVEAGTNAGGTWYWNRYPGARFDSESYSYGYFFSPELLDEWEWSEHFAGQAETERYLNFAVDKFGLRDLMEFDTRIESAVFDEAGRTWTLRTGDGREFRARYVISAMGSLSVPYYAAIPGRERFTGEAYHTGAWPHEPVDFAGKRVAVIGTGASAVQLIPMIAGEVESLTVYQRTPNWCTPLNNGKISAEEQRDIKARYQEIYDSCHANFAGFVHRASRKRAFEDSKEERWAVYEELWHGKGFAKLLSNYRDLTTNPDVTADFSEFVAEKIRRRVADPDVAELLIPKDHGFAMKRPPMETQYYEAYNRPNVTLVDLNKTPIVTVTETGLATSDGTQDFDLIVWATGFDGFTGALLKISVVGTGGHTLAQEWSEGPRTYLGIAVDGFPNLFLVGGPHTVAGNFPRATETQVDFVQGLLEYARSQGATLVQTNAEAVNEWVEHVDESAAPVLMAESSWFRGANIPGKPKKYLLYAGSLPKLRQRFGEIGDAGYPGFEFDSVSLD